MKIGAPLSVSIAAAAAICSAAYAFQSDGGRHIVAPARVGTASPSPLFAKKKGKIGGGSSGGGGGRGFGATPPEKGPKYSIDDKSYGSVPMSSAAAEQQTPEEVHSSMADFFAAHGEWKPLFRSVMCDETSPLASPFLLDPPVNIWGMSTMEQRHPWRMLPSKPESDSSLAVLSTFLDEWQQSLLDIPLDALITGDNDRHFLEEGRRTIAVTRFHVLDEYGGGSYDWEAELFRTCWSELAHLTSQGDGDTGSLVLLPEHVGGEVGEGGGLQRVRDFVESKLVRPIRWLGREDDWEIVAMERGSLAVRLLYRLGDIPDLSERDSAGDEDVKL